MLRGSRRDYRTLNRPTTRDLRWVPARASGDSRSLLTEGVVAWVRRTLGLTPRYRSVARS